MAKKPAGSILLWRLFVTMELANGQKVNSAAVHHLVYFGVGQPMAELFIYWRGNLQHSVVPGWCGLIVVVFFCSRAQNRTNTGKRKAEGEQKEN